MKKIILYLISASMIVSMFGCSSELQPEHKRLTKFTKFEDMEYERPNIDNINTNIEELIQRFEKAEDAEQQLDIMKEYDTIFEDVDHNENYARVNFYKDTCDEFYKNEVDFYDENIPKLIDKQNDFTEVILNSKYIDGIKKEYGDIYIEDMQSQFFQTTPELADLITKENKIVTQFDILHAQSDDEINNIFERKARLSPKKDKLKQFYESIDKYYNDNSKKYDKMFSDLIHIRNEIAKKSGFENYVGYAYSMNNRTSYEPKDIKKYRDNVKKYLSPVYINIAKQAAEHLNKEKLPYMYNDSIFNSYGIELKNNNGVETGRFIASNVSRDTAKCMKALEKYNLMDLDLRDNKAKLAFTTTFNKYNCPFLFASVDDDLESVITFMHEFGHTFNAYMNTFEDGISDDRGLDISEIHSLSMEMLTLDFYDEILIDNADEAIKSHMFDVLREIISTAMLDEYQELIYKNPDSSVEWRKNQYARLYKEYYGDFDYDSLETYKNGGVLEAISHIYTSPFYMMDYSLDNMIAMQIWEIEEEDWNEAYDKYEEIVTANKDFDFNELIEYCNLKNPIKDESLFKDVAKEFSSILFVNNENEQEDKETDDECIVEDIKIKGTAVNAVPFIFIY